MTSELNTASDVIVALAAAIAEHPERVNVEVVPARKAIRFLMTCHAEDEGALIGARGSHAHAMNFLVRRMTRDSDHGVFFELLTNGFPSRRRQDPPTNADYNTEKALELLTRLLSALDIGEFKVTVTPMGPAGFVFTISVKDMVDYGELTVRQPGEDIATIEAIGTLFRAYAKRNGVTFQVNVRRP